MIYFLLKTGGNRNIFLTKENIWVEDFDNHETRVPEVCCSVCFRSGRGEGCAELWAAAGRPEETQHHHRSSEATTHHHQQTHHSGVSVWLGDGQGGALELCQTQRKKHAAVSRLNCLTCALFVVIIIIQDSLARGEKLTLKSNSDHDWNVASTDGATKTFPGVCFQIPPPDPDAINKVDL